MFAHFALIVSRGYETFVTAWVCLDGQYVPSGNYYMENSANQLLASLP
jgi:hypothetical protein